MTLKTLNYIFKLQIIKIIIRNSDYLGIGDRNYTFK